MLFPQSKDLQRLERIKTDPFYKTFLDELGQICDRYTQENTEAVRLDEFMIVYQTGSRKEYERVYFARRSKMNGYFVRYLLYGGEADKRELENIIWAICDEFTWAVPAHVDIEADMRDIHTHIDLFAAETAQALAEIDYILADRLAPQVRRRIRYEVMERTIDSFANRAFSWENMTNNWSAVCAGCVGMAYIYLAPERYGAAQPRLMAAFDKFFSGYGSDGACTEGLSYWTYGFGYYIYFAQLLLEFNGTDMIHNEKIRNIAVFQQHMYMQEDWTVSFSDGHMQNRFQAGLAFYLKKAFGDHVLVPALEYREKSAGGSGVNLIRFAPFIRQYLWTEPETVCAEIKPENTYYADAQWFIARRESYAFAAKGGNNGEPHNHNDLGSFILTAGGRQCLCDLGAGEYTRDYFTEKRYTLLCNASRGHSVPLIDGREQQAGGEFRARVIRHTQDQFAVALEGGYGIPQMDEFTREFRLGASEVELRDSFHFTEPGHQVTERFVSVIPPVKTPDGVRVGAVCLQCSAEPVISEEVIKDHKAEDLRVYRIDYPAENTFCITFRIDA